MEGTKTQNEGQVDLSTTLGMALGIDGIAASMDTPTLPLDNLSIARP